MKIVTINNKIGKEQQCKTRNCFGWKFQLDGNSFTCLNCGAAYDKTEEEFFGEFPRPGRELVDSLNHLQRYAFLKSSDGQSIIKTPMSSGHYIDEHEVMKIAEEAQNEINSLCAQLVHAQTK